MTRVPELRFAGFTGEWEEKSFKENTKLSQGLQIAIEDRFTYPVENSYFYITNEFLKENSSKRYYIVSPNKNVIAKKEDILMTRTGNTGKVITDVEGAFHNNFFKIDYDKKQLNKFFLYHLLNSNKIQHNIINLAGSSTILDLNHKDFYSIKTFFPVVSEQEKIGDLFSKIDQLIENQEKLLDQSIAFKKSMVQKMFPKKDSLVPEFRFDLEDYGFDRGILNDFIVTHGSKNYIANPKVEGKFKVIQQGETPIAGYSNSLPYEDYKNVILFGDHTLSLYKPTSPFLLATDGIKIIFVENINTYYFYYLIQSIMPESQGYKRHYKILRGTQVKIVKSAEEQEKIGNFFKKLDDKIAREEKLLDAYKMMKKSLLQKMFV